MYWQLTKKKKEINVLEKKKIVDETNQMGM